MRKRIKAQNDSPGFEVVMESPLHYSNVMLVDPVSRKPVRARAAWTEGGDKTRVGAGRHASGAPIPKPRAWLQDAGPDTRVGVKDTTPEEALRVTRGAAQQGEEARPDYVAGRLAPPRPAWLSSPAAPAPAPAPEGGAGGSAEEAAEAAALAYEERVEAWARRAYERGLAAESGAGGAGRGGRERGQGQQQQVRRGSTLAAAAAAAGAASSATAAAALSGEGQRRWVLSRTGAPGLGPLRDSACLCRLSSALSGLLLQG
jgi:ribosomal protein L24